MNTPLEIVAGALLLMVFLIYIINKIPMYREERLALLNKYRKTQNTFLKVQDSLSDYILTHDAIEEPILPGISCGEYLHQMKKEYSQNLSKPLLLKIRRCNNRRVINKINSMLNEQSNKIKRTNDLISELQKKSSDNSELCVV
ncbi:hypothetical protein [Flavobacterium beibuense]|uniref:Uncharacterized protein n=1 Tax=Flavobacterium beibuense F44-8 TaxID=1406840 RepID=A0A0A2LRL1_9FLAO|nr:hypothetical protein [Flavobacterium beibuense]KGO81888.1 hypothetical protein Q763_06370 [Flavobacterium beibuense F44-8]